MSKNEYNIFIPFPLFCQVALSRGKGRLKHRYSDVYKIIKPHLVDMLIVLSIVICIFKIMSKFTPPSPLGEGWVRGS